MLTICRFNLNKKGFMDGFLQLYATKKGTIVYVL